MDVEVNIEGARFGDVELGTGSHVRIDAGRNAEREGDGETRRNGADDSGDDDDDDDPAYSFTPRNGKTKNPRPWERKPATPFQPRFRDQKIWKRYDFRERKEVENEKEDGDVQIRRKEEGRAVKRLRKSDVGTGGRGRGGGGKQYVGMKWEEVGERKRRKYARRRTTSPPKPRPQRPTNFSVDPIDTPPRNGTPSRGRSPAKRIIPPAMFSPDVGSENSPARNGTPARKTSPLKELKPTVQNSPMKAWSPSKRKTPAKKIAASRALSPIKALALGNAVGSPGVGLIPFRRASPEREVTSRASEEPGLGEDDAVARKVRVLFSPESGGGRETGRSKIPTESILDSVHDAVGLNEKIAEEPQPVGNSDNKAATSVSLEQTQDAGAEDTRDTVELGLNKDDDVLSPGGRFQLLLSKFKSHLTRPAQDQTIDEILRDRASPMELPSNAQVSTPSVEDPPTEMFDHDQVGKKGASLSLLDTLIQGWVHGKAQSVEDHSLGLVKEEVVYPTLHMESAEDTNTTHPPIPSIEMDLGLETVGDKDQRTPSINMRLPVDTVTETTVDYSAIPDGALSNRQEVLESPSSPDNDTQKVHRNTQMVEDENHRYPQLVESRHKEQNPLNSTNEHRLQLVDRDLTGVQPLLEVQFSSLETPEQISDQENTEQIVCSADLGIAAKEIVLEGQLSPVQVSGPVPQSRNTGKVEYALSDEMVGNEVLESSPMDPTATLSLSASSEIVHNFHDEDTALLKSFLSKAKAKKAAEASSNSVREVSPRKSSRVALGDVQNVQSTSSPEKAKIPKQSFNKETTPDMTGNEETDNAPGQPARRSVRARVKRQKMGKDTSSSIPVRRTDGPEHVVLQNSEAQELALATRTNTKRNKGEAKAPKSKMKDLITTAEGKSSEFNVVRREGLKVVSWDDTLVYFGEEAVQAVQEDAEEEAQSSARRLGGGAVIGTPAPKKMAVVGTPRPKRRSGRSKA